MRVLGLSGLRGKPPLQKRGRASCVQYLMGIGHEHWAWAWANGYPEKWVKLDLRLVWWRRVYPQTQRKVLPSLSDPVTSTP